EAQIKWWKKLYFKGLGEFFYLNEIKATEEDFVEISSIGEHEFASFSMPLEGKCIIPVGGGKDSVVTLELLKNFEGSLPLILNPRPASMGCVMKRGFYYDTIIEVKRSIDPVLLDLNAKGFLNGHTPFSALLAFITLLTAILSGRKYIVLSNESSANESTVAETSVNHQYSKSVEFEGDFRRYVKAFINPDIEYFSLLRPLNELQIAYHFSKFTAYHDVFRSCNAGSKEDSWCGKCAKCLFTYIILSPFLEGERLKMIFGKDLLDDPNLVSLLDELTGISATKPFDCVGTIDEVNAALILCMNRINQGEESSLLTHYKKSIAYQKFISSDPVSLLNRINSEHFLPPVFEDVLKSLHYEGFDQDKAGK
ncbi:MAG: hypothetical protein WCL00_09925, partial [Bacteroidota bacterium]